MVVEVAGGVTVYPARGVGDRWRAVWYEGGRRRQCESVTEAGLAAKLEKVTERLAADAPGMERPGADLIAFYLSPDRHPAGRAWSRKHADTQRRLCARYLAPVIGGLACQDITAGDMQAVVNAAPTAREGARVQRCHLRAGRGRHHRRISRQPAAEAGPLAARRTPRTPASRHHRRGIGVVRGPGRHPRTRGRGETRPRPGRFRGVL